MAKAKTTGKGSGKAVAEIDGKEYATGLVFQVPVTDPLHAKLGNRTPDEIRAINIRKNNAELQLKWAEEEKKAADYLEEVRAKIEKIRCQIEKNHFATEKEIQELVSEAKVAQEGYNAFYRELQARQAEEFKLINGYADKQIEVNQKSFADKARVWKAKGDATIEASRVKADADIAEIGKKKDNSDAQERAAKRKRMEAFIAGEPMDVVNAIGAGKGESVGAGSSRSDVGLLDMFTFNFGK
jgi:hypothetical protein